MGRPGLMKFIDKARYRIGAAFFISVIIVDKTAKIVQP
jgi:hypothetical protein